MTFFGIQNTRISNVRDILSGNTINTQQKSVFDILKEYTIPGAAYNAVHADKCLEGTRVEVMRIVSDWVDMDRPFIFWLHGPAGSGKSTIARTVARDFEKCGMNRADFPNGRLAASFFFSRDAKHTHTRLFFTTLAYQLAISLPRVQEDLQSTLQTNPQILELAPEVQFERLILEPINRLTTPLETKLIIVIDGVDECDKDDATQLIQILAEAKYTPSFPLRFLLTGRADDHIEQKFRRFSRAASTLDLFNFKSPKDIRALFVTLFKELREERSHLMYEIEGPWPSDADIDQLVKNANGLFIYVSTLVQFVGEGGVPHANLKSITESPEKFRGLDSLYKQVLGKAPRHHTPLFRRVLGVLLVLRKPLPIRELAWLLRQPSPAFIVAELENCRSILIIPKEDTKAIQFHHASLPDFLTDQNRSKTNKFFLDPVEHNTYILFDCIATMEKGLQEDQLTNSHLGQVSAFSYACNYWYHHMQDVVQKDKLNFSDICLNGFLAKLESEWCTPWIKCVKETAPFISDLGKSFFEFVSVVKTQVPGKSGHRDVVDILKSLYRILKCIEVCQGTI